MASSPIVIIEVEVRGHSRLGERDEPRTKWYAVPEDTSLIEFAAKLAQSDPFIVKDVKKIRQVATGEYLP